MTSGPTDDERAGSDRGSAAAATAASDASAPLRPVVTDDAIAFHAAVFDAPHQPARQIQAPAALRLIGVDLGTKTIGLAVSDVDCSVASPLVTLKRGRLAANLQELRAICAEQGVAGFVVGLPLNMDGSTGPRAQSARAWARNVCSEFNLPVLLWDERMSSLAAERTLLEADTSRRKRAALIDKMAAAVILQSALDRFIHIDRSARE